jgi:hypothetical protein
MPIPTENIFQNKKNVSLALRHVAPFLLYVGSFSAFAFG